MSVNKLITGACLALAVMQPAQARTGLPNGISSGDTTQTSTVLWASSTRRGTLTFRVKDGGAVVFQNAVAVTDPLVPAKQAVNGLSPGKTYHYEVVSANGSVQTGSFKTAAADDATPGLSFGVTGDWRGELTPYPALRNALPRNLDFFVKLGDTVYADFPSPAVPLPQARTLEEFRRKNREVYGFRHGRNSFARLQRDVSIFATIDDHEVTNDFAGGAPASSDGRFSETTGLINQTALYQNGMRAFVEYNAIADRRYPVTGDALTDGRPDLYRSQRYGKTASLHIVDARSFRNKGLPPVTDITNPALVGAFIAQSFDAGTGASRSMLGRAQFERLKNDLLSAHQDGVIWKFVMVPEPVQNLGVLAASDRYEGYAAERSELLRFIHETGIKNVVFVAADIHATLVNDLSYQRREDVLNALATTGNPLAAPQIRTSAFEVTTGSLAFHPPFGDAVIALVSTMRNGNLLLGQLYSSVGVGSAVGFSALPAATKNAAMEAFINAQLAPLGYNPLGLADNPAINAQIQVPGNALLFSFGWTQFDIAPASHALTVTTYGITPYSEAELAANSAQVLARRPAILGQFRVLPQP